MKRIVLLAITAIVILSSSGCAVLSQKQLQIIEGLSTSSDTLTIAPSYIFEQLAHIRAERGIYYAASLQSSDAKFHEMVAISKAKIFDENTAAKADIYVKSLNSYIRALKSLSNSTRYEQYGTEIRSVGRVTDSIFSAIDSNKWLEDDLPKKLGNLSGRSLALLTQGLVRTKQAKILKEVVQSADTLFVACIDDLIDILQGEQMKSLIKNEQQGLLDNYKAYLTSNLNNQQFTPISEDRRFVELYEDCQNIDNLRKKCISGLRTLSKAHTKLCNSLSKREIDKDKIEDIYISLLELNGYSAQMKTIIEKYND
jgi:hypothetical protein